MTRQPEPAPAAVSGAWLLGALGDADAAWDVLYLADEERQPLSPEAPPLTPEMVREALGEAD